MPSASYKSGAVIPGARSLLARLWRRAVESVQRSRSPLGERPLRAELFNAEQLKNHARVLATQHRIDPGRGPNRLLGRLGENEKFLREAYALTSVAEAEGRRVAPAGEWLLDNYYLIEQQIRVARLHLPRKYSRELPRLSGGPARGFPRDRKSVV